MTRTGQIKNLSLDTSTDNLYDLPLQNEDYDITLKYDELTLNDIQGRNALVMQYEDAAGRRRTEFQFVPKRKPVKFSGQRMILIMDQGLVECYCQSKHGYAAHKLYPISSRRLFCGLPRQRGGDPGGVDQRIQTVQIKAYSVC